MTLEEFREDLMLKECLEKYIEPGDSLLVHSKFNSLSLSKEFLDAILSILTKNGTLFVPTFNFDFCEGKEYHYKKTPSKMGILTEIVRKDQRSIRTPHPIYSFGIIGKHPKHFEHSFSQTCFGSDSLFQSLRELDAKILTINLTWSECMTFFHHVEKMNGCSYRYNKKFMGTATFFKDVITPDYVVSMLVRDIKNGVKTNVNPVGLVCESEGIVGSFSSNGLDMKIMNCNDLFEYASKELIRNPFSFYEYVRNGEK